MWVHQCAIMLTERGRGIPQSVCLALRWQARRGGCLSWSAKVKGFVGLRSDLSILN